MRRVATALLAALLVATLVAGAGGAAAADADEARANLTIEQPPYIDTDVTSDPAGETIVYEVRGPEHRLHLENAAFANVTDAGVLDGPGVIERDAEREAFVLDADGKDATARLYFDVEANNATTRYVADVRVSDAQWTHLPSDEYQDEQDELATWASIKREAESVAPGQDPVKTIEDGLDYVTFFGSPLSSLFADMQGTLVMLFFTPGGLIIGGGLLVVVVVMLARAYRYRNRMQKQLAQYEEIQREIDEAWLKKARTILQQCDLNELFPDHIARALRDYFGRNNWLAFKGYALLRSSESVKGTLLQAMGQKGYIGRLEYTEDGRLVDARVVEGEIDDEDGGEKIPIADGGDGDDDEGDGYYEKVDLTALAHDDDRDRRVIDMIPWDDVDEDVLDEDVDPSEVHFPIDPTGVSDDDLVDALNPEFPGDFEDREQMAEVLGELIQFVTTHPYTDAEGHVRRDMDLLSFLMEMDSILHDDADFPVAYLYQKELLYIAENIDKGDQLRDRVDAAELDGVAGHSISVEGVGGD